MASKLLSELMKQAHIGELVLPDFQRDFVWKTADVLKLLVSLMNRYPIGGLLFMENPGIYAHRLLDGVPSSGGHPTPGETVLVLDGQQRLTSCYRAFYGCENAETRYAGRYYFNVRKFIENREVTGSDLEDLLEFWPERKVKKELKLNSQELTAGLFPLDIVFKDREGVNYVKWFSQFLFNESKGDAIAYSRLSDIQGGFFRFLENVISYQVNFESIPKGTSSDVICTVFETINTTGKRLTVFDLLVARCYPKGIKLRDLLDQALQRPNIKNFDEDGEHLCVTAIPRIISLLSKGQCKRGDMLDLSPDEINRHWDQSIDALELALKYLQHRYGSIGLRYVPFVDSIPPLAVILVNSKFKESTPDLDKLDRWYWRTVFSQYFDSSTETKMARTVREWTSEGGWLDHDDSEPASVREFSYSPNLLDRVHRIDSGLYRGVMSALLARHPRDFAKSRLQLTTDWSGIEDHHIYPKGFLHPYGIKGDAVNSILNRTPLLKQTNQAIGNQAPHVYLHDRSLAGPGGVPDDVLSEHAIPAETVRKPFTDQIFKQFLADRSQLLMSLIEELVGLPPYQNGT